jgi:hypothetical protein
MPYVPIKKSAVSFALMMRDGESLSPHQILNIQKRTGLSPIFITYSQDGELDVSRRYARTLGATLAIPRCAAAAAELLSACNFSICESAEYAIFSLSAKLPTYINASCPKCRSLTARICASGANPNVIMPYTKNRTDMICQRFTAESDFLPAIAVVRNILNLT